MRNKYQMHEIEAYFGEFFEDYERQAREILNKYGWAVIDYHMDAQLCEKVHNAIMPCSDEHFLLAYMMAHTEKYGVDFAIN